MADIQLWCEKCGEHKDHLTVSESRIHICSGCGDEKKFRPGDRASVKRQGKLQAMVSPEQLELIRKRRAADESVSVLAREFGISGRAVRYLTRGVVVQSEETEAAPAETAPALSETIEIKGETKMAKLTTENKADIIRRHEADEATSVLAADFHVSEQTIRNVLNATAKASGKIRVAGKKKGPRKSRQAAPEPQEEQAGGLKAAIQALVDAAVEAKLADLGYVKAEELDAKVADAMARALK